jgi:hypothetical protein
VDSEFAISASPANAVSSWYPSEQRTLLSGFV